jgi:hypothetical protein
MRKELVANNDFILFFQLSTASVPPLVAPKSNRVRFPNIAGW